MYKNTSQIIPELKEDIIRVISQKELQKTLQLKKTLHQQLCHLRLVLWRQSLYQLSSL